MEREMRGVDLEGTIFMAEAGRDALVELGNEQNQLPFGEMDYTDTHYLLRYQPDWRRVATPRILK